MGGSNKEERDDEGKEPLLFRRVLITATATAAGAITGYFSGITEGMAMAFTALTVLDEFVPKYKRSKK